MSDVDFVKTVLGEIVDYPEEIKVDRSVDEKGVFLLVDLAKEDKGKVIGKQGETINAFRKLLHIYGIKNQANISIKIQN